MSQDEILKKIKEDLEQERSELLNNLGPSSILCSNSYSQIPSRIHDQDEVGHIGLVVEDPRSFTGYRIFDGSAWKPWAPLRKKLKKKKKVKKVQELEIDLDAQLKAQQEREKEEYFLKQQEEMESLIKGTKELITLEIGTGYALIIIKRTLAVQNYIERGAGFQPYEAIDTKPYHTFHLLRWGRKVELGPIAKLIEYGQSDIGYELITSADDLLTFVATAKEKEEKKK